MVSRCVAKQALSLATRPLIFRGYCWRPALLGCFSNWCYAESTLSKGNNNKLTAKQIWRLASIGATLDPNLFNIYSYLA